VGAKDVLLADVAVEVEAVEVKLLGLGYFFFGELGGGEEAIESPESPGDGAVEFDAAVVETKDGVCADAGGGEGAEAERDGAGVAACVGFDGYP